MNVSRPILVVTPTLGRSPFLASTVASVTRTLGAKAAHVLVAPAEEVGRLRQLYPQCDVVADVIRHGVYPAINAGLAKAPEPGWKWFTWINDDDEFLPGFAQHAEQALRLDGGSLSAPWMYGLVKLANEKGDSLGRLAVARHPNDIVALAQLGINPLNQQGLLAPRAWVTHGGPLREDLRICADVYFWLRAAVAGAQFRFSAEPVALFRLRRGQISGDEARHRQEFSRVVSELVNPARHPFELRAANLRFRLGNAGVYIERVSRCGWKGGFALLADPECRSN